MSTLNPSLNCVRGVQSSSTILPLEKLAEKVNLPKVTPLRKAELGQPGLGACIYVPHRPPECPVSHAQSLLRRLIYQIRQKMVVVWAEKD